MTDKTHWMKRKTHRFRQEQIAYMVNAPGVNWSRVMRAACDQKIIELTRVNKLKEA